MQRKWPLKSRVKPRTWTAEEIAALKAKAGALAQKYYAAGLPIPQAVGWQWATGEHVNRTMWRMGIESEQLLEYREWAKKHGGPGDDRKIEIAEIALSWLMKCKRQLNVAPPEYVITLLGELLGRMVGEHGRPAPEEKKRAAARLLASEPNAKHKKVAKVSGLARSTIRGLRNQAEFMAMINSERASINLAKKRGRPFDFSRDVIAHIARQARKNQHKP